MENPPAVVAVKSSIVVPASPTPVENRHLFLPAMDLLFRDLPYNRKILFYSLPSEEDYAAAVEKLKTSLSLVLVHFYPLAGRFAMGETDGRLFIDCNDLGVEFVEAALPEVRISDLESANYQMKPFFNKLVPREDRIEPNEMYNFPLLSVQVTRFKGGGIALGFAQHHALADGSSMWHFMNSWGECARGVPISIHPSHKRTALRIDSPSEETARLEFEDVEVPEAAGVDLTQVVFHFSSEVIKMLKERALEEEKEEEEAAARGPVEGAGALTSYEVLCAHVWRSVMDAYKHEEGRKVSMLVVANFRSRVKPPLPEGYFGNALSVVGRAVKTAGELRGEGLARTARKVHEAISICCSEGAIWGTQHWLELNKAEGFWRKAGASSVRMRTSSSPRFPMFKVDFGFGGPSALRAARVSEEGELVFFPGGQLDPGSVSICMALPPHVIHTLRNDPHFFVT